MSATRNRPENHRVSRRPLEGSSANYLAFRHRFGTSVSLMKSLSRHDVVLLRLVDTTAVLRHRGDDSSRRPPAAPDRLAQPAIQVCDGPPARVSPHGLYRLRTGYAPGRRPSTVRAPLTVAAATLETSTNISRESVRNSRREFGRHFVPSQRCCLSRADRSIGIRQHPSGRGASAFRNRESSIGTPIRCVRLTMAR